jgi:hypothetical protein
MVTVLYRLIGTILEVLYRANGVPIDCYMPLPGGNIRGRPRANMALAVIHIDFYKNRGGWGYSIHPSKKGTPRKRYYLKTRTILL